MRHRFWLLILGTLALWVLISLPARALIEDTETRLRVIGYSGTTLLICLVPTALTLLWVGLTLDKSPESSLAAVMGGTGVRLLFVLAVGWALQGNVEFYHHDSFWNWLLGAYLFTLALEMTLLLTGRAAAAPRP